MKKMYYFLRERERERERESKQPPPSFSESYMVGYHRVYYLFNTFVSSNGNFLFNSGSLHIIIIGVVSIGK